MFRLRKCKSIIRLPCVAFQSIWEKGKKCLPKFGKAKGDVENPLLRPHTTPWLTFGHCIDNSILVANNNIRKESSCSSFPKMRHSGPYDTAAFTAATINASIRTLFLKIPKLGLFQKFPIAATDESEFFDWLVLHRGPCIFLLRLATTRPILPGGVYRILLVAGNVALTRLSQPPKSRLQQ